MSRGWVRLLLVAAAVLALDQLTKAIVRSSIPLGDSRRVIGGVLDITNVHNKGVAFGVLAGGGAIVAALTGVALGAIVVYFVMRSRTAYLWLPVGMLLREPSPTSSTRSSGPRSTWRTPASCSGCWACYG